MTSTSPTEEIEATAVGWEFAEPRLLLEALTHSTYANERPHEGPNNERLEFLGDAVLDVVVSDLLLRHWPEAGEGTMSQHRARVVRRASLASLAEELELGERLRLGEGQKRAGLTPSILANAYEAVLGAIFVDGGLEAVTRCYGERLLLALRQADTPVDFKSALQERCHALGLGTPTYVLEDIQGPRHARLHVCRVELAGEVLASGEGSSKKVAQQAAAGKALDSAALED